MSSCWSRSRSFSTRVSPGIEKSLSRLVERGVEKGGITAEQKKAAQARLKGTTSMQELTDCDIIIEAIIENVAEKRRIYTQLDSRVKKDCIFATNTSSICVAELMTATKRPERFVGLHFFNPVPMMKLVEVAQDHRHRARGLRDCGRVRQEAGQGPRAHGR